MKIWEIITEGKRIPRKKGQKRKSKKHSDLYTDEDPKGTIHGLGFKDESTARASVSKIPALTVTLPFIGNNPVIALTTATTAFLLFKFWAKKQNTSVNNPCSFTIPAIIITNITRKRYTCPLIAKSKYSIKNS